MPDKYLHDHQIIERAFANEEEERELEIDLVELMYRMIEKAKWIILFAVVGMIGAGVLTHFFIDPVYESSAELYVLEAKDQVVDLSAMNLSDKLATDYVHVFSNWHVHENVIRTLNLPYTYEEIEDMLKITIPSNTRIIRITVTSKDPQEAYDIAMAYAQIAPAFIEAKMDTSRPNIFEEARIPEGPSAPNMMINVILGFMAGALISVAIIFIQFVSDDRVRNAEMLQKRLGLATLGMMPIQEGSERNAKRNTGKGAKA